MPRYIDAEKAASIENLDDYGDFALGIGDMEDARELLNDAPTVDAAPVVRCGCCKRCHLRGREWFCEVHGITHSDDFCSYGERKSGDPHA